MDAAVCKTQSWPELGGMPPRSEGRVSFVRSDLEFAKRSLLTGWLRGNHEAFRDLEQIAPAFAARRHLSPNEGDWSPPFNNQFKPNPTTGWPKSSVKWPRTGRQNKKPT
jgi:hypothetical protein